LLQVDEVVEVGDELFRSSPAGRSAAVLRAWGILARHGRFDRVMVAHADWRYRLLTVPVRARATSMLKRGIPRESNPIPGRYMGDEYARLLDDDPASRGPITSRHPVADLRHRLPPRSPPAGDSIKIVLVPGGARNQLRESWMRRWPIERYKALAVALKTSGFEIVLIGDENDAWAAAAFEGTDVDDQIGKLTITETLMVLREADLLISHDTGPMHLALLVRTPTLALFGPTVPHHFLVEAPEVVTIWGGAHLPCRPCYDGVEFAACTNNLCMQDISVSRVLVTAEEILHRPQALAP
jgi:heptosyltransferase-2